jgi:hypothetical protein
MHCVLREPGVKVGAAAEVEMDARAAKSAMVFMLI